MTPKSIHWHEASSQEEDSADEFEIPAQSTFNPKKRWLREVWHNDLAKPLDSIAHAEPPKVSSSKLSAPNFLLSPQKQPLSISNEGNVNTVDKYPMNPNQLRPTVLMVASRDRAMPLFNQSAKTSNRPYSTSSPLSSTTANIITVCDSQHQSCSEHSHMHGDRSIVIGPGIQPPPPLSSLSSTASPSSSATAYSLLSSSQMPSMSDSNPLRTLNHQSTERINGRKWLSALALMELASDENSPISSRKSLIYEHSTTQ